MCGITGIIDARRRDGVQRMRSSCEAMTRTLRHRGPDAEGLWVDDVAQVALGHRRLSILDLSDAGSQPMLSASGRYCATFNGEVYNFLELRRELEDLGDRFVGGSDTEVFLAACERWSFAGAIERSNGMFAIAVWDCQARRLHLARDRFGEKPLYYGWFGHRFLFGSELTALMSHPDCVSRVDQKNLAGFMSRDYVASPGSILAGVSKLGPGCRVEVEALRPGGVMQTPYWSLDRLAEVASANVTESDAVERTNELVSRAVELRLRSDVPVGVFLSGGVDSSLIASHAANLRPGIPSFTIGFEDPQFDESDSARDISSHLGMTHNELIVTDREIIDSVPAITASIDEPLADPSLLPTQLLCRLARTSVTVALSGDGGDELFGGYSRYIWLPRVAARLQRTPRPLRRAVGGAINRTSPRQLDLLLLASGAGSRHIRETSTPALKIRKLATLLTETDDWDHVLDSASTDRRALSLLALPISSPPVLHEPPTARRLTAAETMMLADGRSYLPDDVLAKVDRASMSVGLETRAPLLDPVLAQHAWSLPLDMKIRRGDGKWVLRQSLSQYLPQSLWDRPKQGFSVPIADWIRGPLRPWADSLLHPHALAETGLFDAEAVTKRWQEHTSNKRDNHSALWRVLCVQTWALDNGVTA